MKVKIPRKVKISGHSFNIAFDNMLSTDEGDCGQVWYRKNLIRIDPKWNGTHRMQTLFHELLHVIDKNYKCHLDEDNIDRIACGMVELMQNLNIEFDWSEIK